MIIAHIPAGYTLSRVTGTKGKALGAMLLASALPDVDMLWFYFVDHGAVHHHYYWSHAPGFWAIVAAVMLPIIAMFKRQWLPLSALCFSAIFLHLILDTLVGSIMWLWPFSTQFFQYATVPATQNHWVLSFMVHWSFGVEILICALAALLLFRKSRA